MRQVVDVSEESCCHSKALWSVVVGGLKFETSDAKGGEYVYRILRPRTLEHQSFLIAQINSAAIYPQLNTFA